MNYSNLDDTTVLYDVIFSVYCFYSEYWHDLSAFMFSSDFDIY